MKKIFANILGLIYSFSLLVILLICSVEFVAYFLPGHYERAYERYAIEEALSADMDDILKMSNEMLAYLRGNRDSLADITLSTDEGEIVFFNSKEVAHMEDVKEIFLAAITLRYILLALCLAIIIILYLMKVDVVDTLSANYIVASFILISIFSVLAYLVYSDFNKYFIIFHHIFFDNDLWMLDPASDRLIRLVPEGFFIDTAGSIAIVYALLVILCLLISLGNRLYLRKSYKNVKS